MKNLRIENRPNGVYLICDRGVICSFEAGYQQTREQDAKEVLKALKYFQKQDPKFIDKMFEND